MTPNGLSNQLGGVYIGPYTVSDGGGNQFQVICDDFSADTDIGESWTANTLSLGDLTAKFGAQGESKYEEVGYLADTLFNGGLTNSQAADVQYALWSVFTPSALLQPGLSAGDLSSIGNWVSQAQTAASADTAADFSNLVIYTPTSCVTGPGCTPGTSKNLPQEFIGRVPEPSTLLLLSLGLLVIVFYGRRAHSGVAH